MYRVIKYLCVFILLLTASRQLTVFAAEEANDCDNGKGECKSITDCDYVFKNFHFLYKTVKFCDEFNDVVCCPKPLVKTVYRPNFKERFESECARYNDLYQNCTSTPFIVNGQKAEPHEFPHMALIGFKNDKGVIDWKCGGTLISENFILTAAHCLVRPKPEEYHIRLGELDYATNDDDAKPQDFIAKNFVTHPRYDEMKGNDIGLIELNGNATFDKYVFPACLPSTNGSEFTQFTVAGWGTVKYAGDSSTHLLKTYLEPFDDVTCKTQIEDYEVDLNTQICVGSMNSTSDTCQGDSGGPLFVAHPGYSCLKLVVGITSYGLGCGNQGQANVYTRVNLYVDWIKRIVWESAV